MSEWARLDAVITHPNPVCQQANSIFAVAIAHAIGTGADAEGLYSSVLELSEEMDAEPDLRHALASARRKPWIGNGSNNAGWVLAALQNAFWQLLNAPNFEEGVVDTIMRGGDTDTNAAICGALLGAVYGREAIPEELD